MAPGGGEVACEGVLEEGLAIDGQLRTRLLQVLDAFVQLGKKLLDLGDDAALLVDGRDWNSQLLESILREIETAVAYSGLKSINLPCRFVSAEKCLQILAKDNAGIRT